MTREEVLETIMGVLDDQIGLNYRDDKPYYRTHPVTEDTTIEGDLEADSLDKVEMMMEIEETFDFQAADDEIEEIKTLGDLVTFIMENSGC